MKTNETTDKATVRPWRIENYRILSRDGRTSISSNGLGNASEDLMLIVKAVNEHAALVAVAEAAQAVASGPIDHDAVVRKFAELNTALAALVAVREGGVK